jgi:hypothetical protein
MTQANALFRLASAILIVQLTKIVFMAVFANHEMAGVPARHNSVPMIPIAALVSVATKKDFGVFAIDFT